MQSRYYNPKVGRFINADDVGYLGANGLLSHNLFAYCNNNSVNFVDPTGTIPYDENPYDEGIRELGRLIYELITGDTHPDRQAVEIKNNIIAEQNALISSAAKSMWDGWQYFCDTQEKTQRQNATALIEGATYFAHNPKLAEGMFRNMIKTSVSIVGVVSLVMAEAPVLVIGGVVLVAVEATWDITWDIIDVVNSLS